MDIMKAKSYFFSSGKDTWHGLEKKVIKTSADGLLAICIQHEIDHLSGKLFVDYLSSLKRNIIIKKSTTTKS